MRRLVVPFAIATDNFKQGFDRRFAVAARELGHGKLVARGMIVRVFRKLRRKRFGFLRRGGLFGKLEAGPDAGDGRVVAQFFGHVVEIGLGGCFVVGSQETFDDAGHRIGVFRVLSEDVGIKRLGGADVARIHRFLGRFQCGSRLIGDRCSEHALEELTQAVFGDRPHEAVGGGSVLKDQTGRHRLELQLLNDFGVLLDVDLDEADSRAGRAMSGVNCSQAGFGIQK